MSHKTVFAVKMYLQLQKSKGQIDVVDSSIIFYSLVVALRFPPLSPRRMTGSI